MKRIIRLNEQDLNKLVKRVINESDRLKSSIMKMLEKFPINNQITYISINSIEKIITITFKEMSAIENFEELEKIKKEVEDNLGNVYEIEFDIEGGYISYFVKEMVTAYLGMALELTADYYNENYYYDDEEEENENYYYDDEEEEEEKVDWDDFTIYDISKDSWNKVKKDCIKFLSKIPLTMIFNLDAGEVGSDFWLTRNGYGTGFQDRGYDDEVEDALMISVRQFRNQDLYYGDDNQLHLT